MKKFFLVVFCALMLVTVSACGKKNQVTCSATASEDGITMKASITADFSDDDKLTDATVTYDISDSTMAKQYCSLFTLMEDADNGIKVTCSGSKVTITGFAKVIEEEDEETIVGLSKEKFIEYMQSTEDQSYTCK